MLHSLHSDHSCRVLLHTAQPGEVGTGGEVDFWFSESVGDAVHPTRPSFPPLPTDSLNARVVRHATKSKNFIALVYLDEPQTSNGSIMGKESQAEGIGGLYRKRWGLWLRRRAAPEI